MKVVPLFLFTLITASSALGDRINFIWSPDAFQTIPNPPGHIASYPTQVNDSGVVAGGTNPSDVVLTWSAQGYTSYQLPRGYDEGSSAVITNTGVVGGNFATIESIRNGVSDGSGACS